LRRHVDSLRTVGGPGLAYATVFLNDGALLPDDERRRELVAVFQLRQHHERRAATSSGWIPFRRYSHVVIGGERPHALDRTRAATFRYISVRPNSGTP
jgi:hypothetical protein